MSDRNPTLADVCSAIADGHIAAVIDGSMYRINALELRRYLNKLRSLPVVSVTAAPDSSPRANSPEWPAVAGTSIA
jgi:hypothetical protein